MVIEKNNNTWQPKLKNDQPVILDISQITNFYQKVGRNSDAIFHPEEIIVDNLKLLANNKKNIPTTALITNIKKLLAK